MGVNDPNTILQQRRWWRINFLEFFSRKNKVFIKIRNKILCFSVAVWKYQIFFECHFFRWICFLYVWKLFGMFIRRNKFFQVSSKWITSKPSFQSLKKNERIKATTTTTTASHFSSSSSSSSMSTIWIQTKKYQKRKEGEKFIFFFSVYILLWPAVHGW